MKVVATSTCVNDLGFSFYGQGGSLLIQIPAMAQDFTVVVVGE